MWYVLAANDVMRVETRGGQSSRAGGGEEARMIRPIRSRQRPLIGEHRLRHQTTRTHGNVLDWGGEAARAAGQKRRRKLLRSWQAGCAVGCWLITDGQKATAHPSNRLSHPLSIHSPKRWADEKTRRAKQAGELVSDMGKDRIEGCQKSKARVSRQPLGSGQRSWDRTPLIIRP